LTTGRNTDPSAEFTPAVTTPAGAVTEKPATASALVAVSRT
jgi:hypothetical protein